MTVEIKFTLSLVLIALSMTAGYISRTRGYLREESARKVMAVVMIVGYPTVGFFAIWNIPLQWSDAWLPVLGVAQATLLSLFALWAGRWLFADKLERGLVGFSCGVGNHGITMAGFVVFLIFGSRGLALNTVYAIYTFFAYVLLSFSIAQAYQPNATRQPLMKLMVKNLLSLQAMGLYTCTAAVLLTSVGVPRPACFDELPIIDIMIFLVIVVAYFSIGLRLHLPHVLEMKRAILSLIVIRHGVGLLIGFGLIGLICLTPWPLSDLARKVVIIQASVPMGVMGVAVANLFNIKPREASALFLISSIAYLLLGVPLVMWIFG